MVDLAAQETTPVTTITSMEQPHPTDYNSVKIMKSIYSRLPMESSSTG